MFDDPVVAGVLLGECGLQEFGGVVEAELAVLELCDEVASIGWSGGDEVVEFDEAVVALDLGSDRCGECALALGRVDPVAVGHDRSDQPVPLAAFRVVVRWCADPVLDAVAELVAGDERDALAPGPEPDGVRWWLSGERREPVGLLGQEGRRVLVDLVVDRGVVEAVVAGVDAVVWRGCGRSRRFGRRGSGGSDRGPLGRRVGVIARLGWER